MIASWPVGVNYRPYFSSWSMQPYLAPLRSDMDGGNVRERARPGDDIRIVRQTLWIERGQFSSALQKFLLDNRGRRIVMPVWLGAGYKTCVVQLIDPQVSNASSSRVDIQMSLRVLRELLPLEIFGTPETEAQEGEVYSWWIATASGGIPIYTFSIHAGTLPAGISLNSQTGVMSGTATESGTFAGIVVRVTDQQGETADLDPFTLVVSEAP